METSTDWQIRDSVALHTEVDEMFKLLVRVAQHIGINTELEEKYFKNAQDFRYQRGSHTPEGDTK